MSNGKQVIVDNTGRCNVPSVSSVFPNEIRAAVENGGTLPDELADLFTLTRVEINDETRWILNYA